MSSKKEVPAVIVEQLKTSLPKDGHWGSNTYSCSWLEGSIGDVTIGMCCSKNHVQDEHGVAATSQSITDFDPSDDFHVFAFRGDKLLWIHRKPHLHSLYLEDGIVKLDCRDTKVQAVSGSRSQSIHLDPVTGESIESP